MNQKPTVTFAVNARLIEALAKTDEYTTNLLKGKVNDHRHYLDTAEQLEELVSATLHASGLVQLMSRADSACIRHTPGSALNYALYGAAEYLNMEASVLRLQDVNKFSLYESKRTEQALGYLKRLRDELIDAAVATTVDDLRAAATGNVVKLFAALYVASSNLA